MEARTAGVVSVVLLVAAAVAATGAGAATPAATEGSGDAAVAPALDRPVRDPGLAATPPGNSIRDQVDTDRIRLRVDVEPDGTARWTVEYFTELDDDNTTAAFESLQSDVRANPDDYVQRFASRIRATVDTAENATGREMAASDFEISTRQTQSDFGVVAYTYEWSNFAQVREGGDRLVIGDAIEGYFLDDKSSMIVSWPEGYERASVDPEADSTSGRSVAWEGSQTDFLPGQPEVVATTTTGGTTTTAGGTTDPAGGDGGGGDGGDGGDGDGGVSLATVLLAVVVLGVAAAGVFYFTRREDPAPVQTSGSDGDDGSAGGDAGTAGAAGATADDGEGDGDGDADADEDEGGDDEPAIDEELLSNEERVLRLLEANGGRVKQQEVVQELGWTEAKTSQVVSGMRDEGAIDGFRLGRENVLTLPEMDDGPLPGDEDDGDDQGGDDERTWN